MQLNVYVINLKKRVDKRKHILAECSKLNMSIEVINAVDGSQLSEEDLKQYSRDYPDNGLTAGEIGCALSHLKIYQKMIDTHCSLGLILEDDAQLHDGLDKVLEAIVQHEKEAVELKPDEPRIYLLSPAQIYWDRFKKPLCDHYTLHKVADAYYGHGYILNQSAAHSLKKFLQSVSYEIDRWGFFQQMNVAKVWCIVPPLITSMDDRKISSDLEEERKSAILKRAAYYRMQRKRMPLPLKFKKVFWKTIGIHFVKIVRSKPPS